MGKTKFNKRDIFVLGFRVLGILLILLGVLFFCIKFSDDYNHDLKIEVNIASPTDEFYTIKLNGMLVNNSDKELVGTLNVKLKDGRGKVATATFKNITLSKGSKLDIEETNNSTTTYLFDNVNGLDYDMKINEVTIGGVELLEYSSRPIIALPLLIGGVAILLVVQLLIDRQGKESLEEDD